MLLRKTSPPCYLGWLNIECEYCKEERISAYENNPWPRWAGKGVVCFYVCKEADREDKCMFDEMGMLKEEYKPQRTLYLPKLRKE